MKHGNVTPVHKKGTRLDKKNFRSVSTLPNFSKDFERCVFKQMSNYFENFFKNS